MAKNSVIISVSIPKDQAEFLDTTELSPSDLIQEKILEQKRSWDAYHQEKAKILRNLESLQKEIGIHFKFLDETGKFDEFRKWRGENARTLEEEG